MNVNAKTFWQRINQQLKKKNATQKDLAAFIGIPQRTIENWIYRGNFPLITEGYRMAKFLNVSIEYLVTGKERNDENKINTIRSLIAKADEKLIKL